MTKSRQGEASVGVATRLEELIDEAGLTFLSEVVLGEASLSRGVPRVEKEGPTPPRIKGDALLAVLRDVAPASALDGMRRHADTEFLTASDVHGLLWLRVTFTRGPGATKPAVSAIVRRFARARSSSATAAIAGVVDRITTATRGLVIVTGPRLSGRTGALAAIAARIAASGRAVEAIGTDLVAALDVPESASVLARHVTPDGRPAALEAIRFGQADAVLVDDVETAEDALALSTLALGAPLVVASIAASSVPTALGRWLGPRGRGPSPALLAETLAWAVAMMPLGRGGPARRAFEILRADEAARAAIRGGELEALERLMLRG